MSKVTGGVPIPSEHSLGIYHTVVSKLSAMFNIPLDSMMPIGSTLKKNPGEFVGDIDIGLDVNLFHRYPDIGIKEIQNVLTERLNCEYDTVVNNTGTRVISFLYPIPNSSEFVQVDIMVTDNLDLTSFIFHSPDFTINESQYKGVVRNVLLFSIVRSTETDTYCSYYEDGSVRDFTKYSLMDGRGLVRQLKTYEGKNGRLKNPRPIKGMYVTISKNPTEIVKYIFGEQYEVEDMNSFESIYKILHSKNFKQHHLLSTIIDNCKIDMKIKKLEIPTELTDFELCQE